MHHEVGASKPRFDSERASRLLSGITYRQIPDTGHFLHVFRPSRVADLVEAVSVLK